MRGRVVDVGTHEELVARCAQYRFLLGGDLAPRSAGCRTLAADPGAGIDAGRHLPHVPALDAGSATGVDDRSCWPRDSASAGGATGRGRTARRGWRPRLRPGSVPGPAAGAVPGGGGMMGGMLGAGPATPELMAQVAALPPAPDQPREIPAGHQASSA